MKYLVMILMSILAVGCVNKNENTQNTTGKRYEIIEQFELDDGEVKFIIFKSNDKIFALASPRSGTSHPMSLVQVFDEKPAATCEEE